MTLQEDKFPSRVVGEHERRQGVVASCAPRVLFELRASLAADLDGDGDLDIVAAAEDTDYLPLVGADRRHPGGVALNRIEPAPGGAIRLVAADVDGDGDTDLVTVSPSSIGWWENLDARGRRWVRHEVVAGVLSRVLHVVDLDLDGDLDLIGSGAPGVDVAPAFWLENVGGRGATWLPHEFGQVSGCTAISTADLDGDGDEEIVTCGVGDALMRLENRTLLACRPWGVPTGWADRPPR